MLLINALDEDADGALSASAKRIGGPLLFGKIWERLGIGDVLGDLLRERAFEFAAERAVFVATLHRIFVSGSDRDCSSWMEDYDIAGSDGLDLHHFYCAMAWLGEEMEEKNRGRAGAALRQGRDRTEAFRQTARSFLRSLLLRSWIRPAFRCREIQTICSKLHAKLEAPAISALSHAAKLVKGVS